MQRKIRKNIKHFQRYKKRFAYLPINRKVSLTLVVVLVAFIGVSLLYAGIAATFATSKEAENGTLAGNAALKNGPNASNGQYVKFGNASAAIYCAPTVAMPAANCRPLIGAVAKTNPGTPTEIANGTAPAQDSISQQTYFEQLTNQVTNVYRDYHASPSDDVCVSGTCASGNSVIPVNTNEQYFAGKGKALDINWNVALKYKDAESLADGGTQYIHDNIVQAAKNIKALAPTPVFFSPWHETQLGVSQTDPEDPAGCTPGTAENFGSPDEFKKAWINIHNIFANQGVTNVIWTLNYASYQPRDCFVPLLWPGNQYVDWIIYDSYDHGGKTFDNTIGRFYDLLKSDSTSAINFNSKPWGIGEFGTGGNLDINNVYQYYQDGQADFDNGTYPNLHWYNLFAENGAPGNHGFGALTDYRPDSSAADPSTAPEIYDAKKQQIFNAFWADLVSGAPGPQGN